MADTRPAITPDEHEGLVNRLVFGWSISYVLHPIYLSRAVPGPSGRRFSFAPLTRIVGPLKRGLVSAGPRAAPSPNDQFASLVDVR